MFRPAHSAQYRGTHGHAPRDRRQSFHVGSVLVAAALLAACSAQSPQSPPAQPATPRAPPGFACGTRAAESIAGREAEVAALNEMTADALLKTLRSDPSACIDKTGRMFFIEPPAD
jgi:hypothetical protein